MNFFAGVMLQYFSNEDAFLMLCIIFNKYYLHKAFEDLLTMKESIFVLDHFLKKMFPEQVDHLVFLISASILHK